MKTSDPAANVYAAIAKAQGAGDWEAESILVWQLAVRKRANRKSPSVLNAFMDRLAFGLSDCWYWVGVRSGIGYGMFVPARDTYGLPEVTAHRISWHLFNGPVPEGLNVLHRCDVRACVNPEHLFLGTQADNVRDMVQKGRNRSRGRGGELNPMSKLTAGAVLEMRALHDGGVNQHEIARRFGVAVMTVNRAVRGLTWRTV